MNSYPRIKHYGRPVLLRLLRLGHIGTMTSCLAAAGTLSTSAFAQGTLAIADLSEGLGVGYGVCDNVRLSFGIQQGTTDLNLIDALVLAASDVNRLFVIAQAQSENFTSFVSLLTNGVSDTIDVNLTMGSGGGGLSTSEQRFFTPLPSGGNGIDFLGYHIDNIALQVEEITFAYPGEYQTSGTFRGRILVNSEPLPTNALAILLPPSSQNAGPGSTVDLAVLAIGEPPLAYQWFFNQTQPIRGASGCSLLLTNVQPAQAGAYSVVVSNAHGSLTSSIALLNVIDPCINNQPTKWGVPLGREADFYADAGGTPPFSYQWLKNGTNLNDGGTISGAHTYHLELGSVISADAGAFAVAVSNSHGSITSLVANLIVQDPFITAQPRSCHVHLGGTVQLSGSGGGSPPLNYQWFKDNVSLTDGGRISGARSSTLPLNGAGPADSGNYTFVVWNTGGSAPSMAATLTVDDPFIAVQPADLVLQPEEPARFDITAGGTAPLSYQWLKDGTALNDGEGISGTRTPTLTLTEATGADVGQYWVVVSNASGSVSSATAMLVLNSAAYSILHTFTGVEGAFPNAGLQLSGQTLYGTAGEGGPYGNHGTVFKLNTDGSGFTVIKALAGGSEGTGPSGAIALSGVTLYGGNYMGGLNNYGVVYRLNTNGSGYTVLRNFSTSDGPEPAGVTLFENNLYGTTQLSPVLFRLGTDGNQYTLLRRFLNGDWCCADFLFLDGELYGTGGGGDFGQGGIFKMDLNGNNFTVLKAFSGTEGKDPAAGLVSSGGTFYGTMANGGSNGCGTVFRIHTDGSGLQVLKHFGGDDGAYPNSTLVLSGNKLIGTTDVGGKWGLGTIFMLNTDGTGFTVLRSFAGSDGAYPVGRLVLAGSTLYGMTHAGGSAQSGVVFSLSVAPLGILASPQTQTAEAGSSVRFWVRTADEPGLLYQWFFNGTSFTGWTTNSSMELTDVQFSQSGAYAVILSNRFGAVTSCRTMLNVIAPVPRRWVPALNLRAQAGKSTGLDYRDSLDATATWQTLSTMTLSEASEFCFDLTPLPFQRSYRAWQSGTGGVAPWLNLNFVPAITLTGNVGGLVRVDCINQFGPTNAWVMLDTVTLTNISQLYFDVSSIGQPPRLWRIVSVP